MLEVTAVGNAMIKALFDNSLFHPFAGFTCSPPTVTWLRFRARNGVEGHRGESLFARFITMEIET